jgi:hypothetical protein
VQVTLQVTLGAGHTQLKSKWIQATPRSGMVLVTEGVSATVKKALVNFELWHIFLNHSVYWPCSDSESSCSSSSQDIFRHVEKKLLVKHIASIGYSLAENPLLTLIVARTVWPLWLYSMPCLCDFLVAFVVVLLFNICSFIFHCRAEVVFSSELP